MQVSWKRTHAVPHVQGSTSRSLVCRSKRRLIGRIELAAAARRLSAAVRSARAPITKAYNYPFRKFDVNVRLCAIHTKNKCLRMIASI